MVSIRNAMTIDVEDYFQVSAFAPHISRQEWDSLPCRVERNVDLILGLLDDADVKATFFTLGWIAERHPNVVRIIVDNGHELASHGYGHQRASDLTPEEFRLDVVRAKHVLEDAAGLEVKGYRAPSFSISGRNRWALDVLSETGHAYSSSIYPVRHDHYGAPDAPRHPYRPNGQRWDPGTAAHDCPVFWPQPAGGRRRLFQAHALWCVALAAQAGESARARALHVLFPSLGSGSRPATTRRTQYKNPLPALRQSAANAGETRTLAEGFSLGKSG